MNSSYLSTLSEKQIHQVQEQSHALWSDGLSLTDRVTNLKTLMAFSDHLDFAGLLDDSQNEIVCSLKRYKLHLTDGSGSSIRAIGIGAVFTPEKHRRSGYAEKLVKCVLADAGNCGVKAALLFSDIDPKYYERVAGFKAFPTWKFTGPVKSLTSVSPLEIRAAREDDIPWMLEAYDNMWPKNFLRVKRDIDSWKFYRLRNAKEPDLVISQAGRKLGYLTCHKDGAKLFVSEMAAVNANDLNNLWGAVRQVAIDKNLEHAYGWLAKATIPQQFMTEQRDSEIAMVTAIDKNFGLETFSVDNSHFGPMDYF